MNSKYIDTPQATIFGHPVGLFTLFFAEMWERFSYYGMRALLVFYMTKGFLGYGDKEAYAVYGAYTALVFMTPFFGGMLADRLLGTRRAVVLGGLLMAAGHLLMTVEANLAFFTALALLICGNGFFKPNISTTVGSLYRPGSRKRDGGFTIFYIGINLGAAMSPLLCGYIGETYGYHKGFGLATIGMLVGVAVFVAPTVVTQVLIGVSALAAAVGLFIYVPGNPFAIAFNVFVGISLLGSGVVALVALARGGLPAEAGGAPYPERLKKRVAGFLPMEWAVYLGTILAVPVFVLLVSGFSLFREDGRGVTLIPTSVISSMEASDSVIVRVLSVVVYEISRPAGLVLISVFLLAFLYVAFETVRLEKIARNRMYVVFILTLFSILFWSSFEQAGSSLNNFTDRNIDRVRETRVADAADVGTTIWFRIPLESKDGELVEMPLLSQEQLGYRNESEVAAQQIEAAIRAVEQKKGNLKPEEIDNQVRAVAESEVFTLTGLSYLRAAVTEGQQPAASERAIPWVISPDNIGMGIGDSELPASMMQAANPTFILIFGLVLTALWTFLANRNLEPSTPVKFSLGLIQLGLGFGAFWYGAHVSDDRGMVLLTWLMIGYLLHTTGELCLSPVGLSMVTKLAPAHLVSTVMGMWFLATAFSQLLAAIIAQFTGVTEGSESVVPAPIASVDVYGGVFGKIALFAIASGLFCLVLSPVLRYWMHEDHVAHVEES
jgi:POT family proton-dependent oligopeptide transporter